VGLPAQDSPWKPSFSAFGTLGEAQSSTDLVEFRANPDQLRGLTRKPSYFLDTRFGLQASMELDPTLFATVQVVSRYRFDGTYRPLFTLATLTWNPLPALKVRGGVFPLDAVPSGEYPDVGYSCLWVRPPVETFLGARNPIVGLDLRATFPAGANSTLEWRGFGGRYLGSVAVDHVGPMSIAGAPDLGTWLKFSRGPWQARVTASLIGNTHSFPQPIPTLQAVLQALAVELHDPQLNQAAADLWTEGRNTWGMEADLTFQQGPVQAEALLAGIRSHAYLIPPDRFGYISLGYRVGQVVPYGVFARNVSERVQPMPLGILPAITAGPLAPVAQGIVASLTNAVDQTAKDQNTYSLGLRWDFSRHADLKFQVDTVRAHNAWGLEYNPSPDPAATWNGHMTVTSVCLDFILGGGR
jgi:hypothetical protein